MTAKDCVYIFFVLQQNYLQSSQLLTPPLYLLHMLVVSVSMSSVCQSLCDIILEVQQSTPDVDPTDQPSSPTSTTATDDANPASTAGMNVCTMKPPNFKGKFQGIYLVYPDWR